MTASSAFVPGAAAGDLACWGAIAALTAAAFILIVWGTLAGGRSVGLLLELVGALVGLTGLLGTFLQLKAASRGATAEGGLLRPDLAPALAGLGVFMICQAALGVLRFRFAPPGARRETASPPGSAAIALPNLADGTLSVALGVRLGPAVTDAVRDVPVEVLRPRPRLGVRRPAPPPRDGGRRAIVFAACLLGSILIHSAAFLAALRVRAYSAPGRKDENDGVFLARLVPALHRPEAAPPEAKEEPPPKPVPAPKEAPPPPEPAKPEPAEAEAATERPQPPPAAERPKAEPAPAPAPPPPAAEAKETPAEPAPRGTEGKEAEIAKAPPARFTESSAPAKEPPAPAPPAQAPVRPASADAPAAPKPPPEGAVLGLGDPGKNRDKAEPSADATPGGNPAAISTMKDYRQFLSREMKGGASEGRYVPNLRFADNRDHENREIMRYFGMELIAYPKNQKFYVYIDPDQGLYSRSNDFTYIHNFSNRAIFRTSPYFDALRAEAARRIGVPVDSLVMAQLLKPSSAAYIGWKESECARRAGASVEDVEACDARFVKTPFGIWIVRIDRLLMKDGRKIEIEDFEWAKVSPAGGGER